MVQFDSDAVQIFSYGLQPSSPSISNNLMHNITKWPQLKNNQSQKRNLPLK